VFPKKQAETVYLFFLLTRQDNKLYSVALVQMVLIKYNMPSKNIHPETHAVPLTEENVGKNELARNFPLFARQELARGKKKRKISLLSLCE
jgi:hypothetical protein